MPPSAPPGNVAAGRLTLASTRWDFSYPAEAATDGDLATRWCSARDKTGGEWIEVNFGQPVTFDRLVIRPFDDRITGHRIEAGLGGEWRLVNAGGAVAFPVHHETIEKTTSDRLRFVVTAARGPASIWEIEVRLAGRTRSEAGRGSGSGFAPGIRAGQRVAALAFLEQAVDRLVQNGAVTVDIDAAALGVPGHGIDPARPIRILVQQVRLLEQGGIPPANVPLATQ